MMKYAKCLRGWSVTGLAKILRIIMTSYDYFECLPTKIPKHLDDTGYSFLDDLLPWSLNLPVDCQKPGKEVK